MFHVSQKTLIAAAIAIWFCKLQFCCKMNVRMKPKVQWHWHGVKLAKLCKRKLDFEVTLDDVIGMDNIAIIVEAMQGTNLCQKS